MLRPILGLGLFAAASLATIDLAASRASAQGLGETVVSESVVSGPEVVTYGDRVRIKYKRHKTVIRDRPGLFAPRFPLLRESRVYRAPSLVENRVIESPPIVEERIIQPAPTIESRVVEPAPVIRERVIKPSTVIESQVAPRGASAEIRRAPVIRSAGYVAPAPY